MTDMFLSTHCEFAVEGDAAAESRLEAARRRLTDLVARRRVPCCATACARPGATPAGSSCSRARPASAMPVAESILDVLQFQLRPPAPTGPVRTQAVWRESGPR